MTASTTAGETAGASAAAGLSLPARIAGVIVSPRATYAAVAAKPRALGVLLFILIVGGSATYAFMSTEVGMNALLDEQVRQTESWRGRAMTDAEYAQIERMAPYGKYFAIAGQAIGLPIAALIVSGIAFGVFNALMGGEGTFKQVFAVIVHSGVVMVLTQLFGLPLAYARGKVSSATNLAVFAPFLDDNSFAARLLGSVDLVILWWILSAAIGLGVLYKKRTSPIATTMIVVYIAIGVVIAAYKTAVAGA